MVAGPSGGVPTRSSGTTREIGRQAALFVSVGAIIGSGWLFASFDASQFSGGSAVLAWLVAGLLAIFLALNYAELGSAFPVDGGIGRFPLFAFGRSAGFLAGWLSWISAVCVAPIETVFSLRYASNYIPGLNAGPAADTHLSPAGLAVAAAVLAAFTILNLAGIRWFRETNNVLVLFKIAAPLLIAVVLLGVHFQAANFTAHGGFFAFGGSGVLRAISEGGVAFSIIGFEQAVQLGGETRNPQRNIPYALLGSAILATFLYAWLQVAFTGALGTGALARGWVDLSFPGDYGPLAGLAKDVGVAWVAVIVYLAASISPAGTGLTYTATSSRVPYAMAQEGYLPAPFSRTSRRHVPRLSLLVCYGVELVLLLVFRQGQHLLVFATAVVALVYALAPLSLAVLRRTAPKVPRPYRLPRHQLFARVAFVVANLIFYWCGWDTTRYIFAAVILAGVVQGLLALAHANYRHSWPELRAASWMVLYVGGLALISFFGRYQGGTGAIPQNWDLFIVTVFSLIVFELAVRMGETAHARLPEGERPYDHWHRVARTHGHRATVHEDAPSATTDGPPLPPPDSPA